MRIRQSVSRTISALVVPAICAASVLYFGYFTIWGNRGLVALAAARHHLTDRQIALLAAQGDRLRLQRRVELLARGGPDIIEELRRDQSLGALPGEISVRRNR